MAWGSRGFGKGRGFALFPPGIKFLLISNVAVFLIEMFFGAFHFAGGEDLKSLIERYFALWPFTAIPGLDAHFMPWQLLTYMFLHGNFMHILFNMFALWMFGIEVENTWGTKKFLTYYTLCGLGAAAAHLILSTTLGIASGPLVGASGGIFGVLVAYGVMFPDNRIVFFPIFFPIKARFAVGIFIVIEVLSVGGNDNVGHLAHLGGAITGILYMLITSGGHMLRQRGVSSTGTRWQPTSNGGAQKPAASFWKKPPARPGYSVDADYTDVNERATPNQAEQNVKRGRVISQEEIDRILDKIAASGYQALTDEERDILFEASKRMEERH
jgi:membrane associated rhomboid family serine protease